MADRKISDLTALTATASGDYVPIVDISEGVAASKNKRVTIQSLFQGIPVNLGIGTSSPGSKLEIRNDVTATTSLDATAIKLYNNLDGGSGIEFLNAVAGKSKISFGVESSGAGTNETYLGFSTCLEGGALTERLHIDSSGRVGIGTTSPTTLLDVNADTVRVRTARTPASASATGATGEICWDASYIYVCTATNTWRRSAISSW